MDLALVLARVSLTAVFALAGLAKLFDAAGSRQALIDFGLSARLATLLGRLLPLAELGVAAALLPAASAWWGAVSALILLLLFVASISLNLARGRTPNCHCFGQLHSAPASPSTLLRNLVLAGVAAFVAWQGAADPGPSVVGWMGELTTIQRVALLGGLSGLGLLGAVCWLLVQVLRQQGRLLLRLDTIEARLTGGMAPLQSGSAMHGAPQGLPVGTAAPPFELPDLDGTRHSLEGLRAAGKAVVLVFSDPNCGPCNSLLPEIGRWQRDHAQRLTVAVIGRGSAEVNRTKATAHGVSPVLLQNDYEVALAYQAYGTPSAVLVRPDGVVGSALAPGADAIRDLVAQALEPPPPVPLPLVAPTPPNGRGPMPHTASRPKVGERPPAMALPNLSGKVVGLSDFRGDRLLVLFWNPDCGFCQRMLGDLQAWEMAALPGAPRLVVISAGSVEANRALSLRAPILLDSHFSAGRAFGAAGTPSAVLVDAEGRIASELAVGAEAVLALAGARAR